MSNSIENIFSPPPKFNTAQEYSEKKFYAIDFRESYDLKTMI